MTPRLLNLLTLLSLLLCVAVCVLAWVDDPPGLQPPSHLSVWGDARVTLCMQGLSVYNTEYPYQGSIIDVSDGTGRSRMTEGARLDFPVYYRHFMWPDRPPVWVLTVPLYLIVLLTAFLPAVRLVLMCIRTGALSSQWKQPSADTCRACTYGLTGNVSGVCPECGREVNGTGEARTMNP